MSTSGRRSIRPMISTCGGPRRLALPRRRRAQTRRAGLPGHNGRDTGAPCPKVGDGRSRSSAHARPFPGSIIRWRAARFHTWRSVLSERCAPRPGRDPGVPGGVVVDVEEM